MKKIRLLFLTSFCLSIYSAYAQIQPVQEYNRWGLKSIGFFATYGAEKFFKPLTFSYFQQNSGMMDSRQYFALPKGASDDGSRDLDDVPPLGLGFQLAWPVGKRHNEIRAGFAFQQHHNSTSAYSVYHLSPDTIRMHSVNLHDEYVISQASFDYVFYTKPLLRNARLLWRVGSTFGISTRHDLYHTETITDLDTADVNLNRDGSISSYNPSKARTYFLESSLGSSTRLEAGLRTSAGIEIILNIFHQQIGLSAEYGHGLAAQKVLKGGTTDFKRTELGQVQARYFLR